ncbi:hypothetical protein [Streptomyces sp. NRRL S-378]|uniref:hypothetical protein n=1 Tax=Streptomyces sp. NRRL S-378 TaxID=1463904 RepID=UPI0004C90B25|nr:hypothetical protein [Streptomyces sp. NRRL S-378]
MRRLEQVHGGQAGLAVDELEGDFGAGGKVERVESFGVGGVDDPVEAGSQERRGCTQGGTRAKLKRLVKLDILTEVDTGSFARK